MICVNLGCYVKNIKNKTHVEFMIYMRLDRHHCYINLIHTIVHYDLSSCKMNVHNDSLRNNFLHKMYYNWIKISSKLFITWFNFRWLPLWRQYVILLLETISWKIDYSEELNKPITSKKIIEYKTRML